MLFLKVSFKESNLVLIYPLPTQKYKEVFFSGFYSTEAGMC